MLTPLLAAAVVAAPHVSPVLHYRLEYHATRQLDRSGGAAEGNTFTIVAFVSVTVRDSTVGSVGHVVIDSVRSSGTGLFSMAYDSTVGMASKGAWYDVALARAARGSIPVPSIRNPVTFALDMVLRTLFAPDHPSPQAGERWADTVQTHASGENWTQTGPTVTAWKVVAPDSGRTALEAEISGVVTITGRMAATGLVIGKRQVVLNADGTVHHATISTNQQTLLAPQNAPEILNARSTTTAAVTLLADRP